ncbi:MAG: twin-arginine translocation signal domain-containing protein [Pseudomonadota bacterium]|nr:twin-arginine translocation signal domain-containing protein [Pseudomonadota bacterium]
MDLKITEAPAFSRRKFLGGAAATAAAGTLLPGCRFVAGSGSNTIPEPPDFPAEVELYQQGFVN